ncbi:PASTA domain-containing protein [Demequina sp.]|uniref:PASTA domain-containing protein n=1 Tax=Demequina sp. TaxID=2050685 RepID=UPI0025C39F26|nr:PASTA domain-containing protein [Demequina sp.]
MSTETNGHVGPEEAPERYTLVRRLSSGGEGDLWEATVVVGDGTLPVAIKAIHAVPGVSFDESSRRVADQAEILKSLDHPGIVKVREYFAGRAVNADKEVEPSEQTLYVVMNYVAGQDLSSWVRDNPQRDPLTVSRMVSGLAAAMAHLHSGTATGGAPVLHRDIKPANVIVGTNGQTTLVDFGLARLASPDALTIVGTPQYFAPEVLGGLPPSEASDRYGLGAVAYFLYTGEAPNLSDQAATRAKLLQVDGVSDREGFADHLMAMLSSDPARRPTDVVVWAQGLAMGTVSGRFGYAASSATKKSRRGMAIIIAVAAVVILGGGAVFAATSGMFGGDGGTEQVAEGELMNLVGLTLDEAKAELETLSIIPDVVYEATEGEEGIVLAQDPAPGTASPETVTLTVSGPDVPVEMPDLVGLTLAEARADLAEIDIIPVVVYEPSGEPEGTVLAQDPEADAEDPQTVTLTVAEEPTTVPDVTQSSLNDALATLEGLGITVTTADVLNEDVPDGQVVAQSPEAGEPFEEQVLLTVARQPVIDFLADMRPVEGSIGSGPASVSGVTYTRSVTYRLYYDDPSQAGFDLGRDYREFRTTLGASDESPSDVSIKFEIYGDGRLLHDSTLSFGASEAVSVDVTGVLRLELRATRVAGSGRPYSVFADARILGSPDEVPAESSE